MHQILKPLLVPDQAEQGLPLFVFVGSVDEVVVLIVPEIRQNI